MSKLRLDDVEWGTFKIRNIFMIEKVIGKPIENYPVGNTPYVSTASTNNALVSFVDDINSVSKGNTISVDPIKGSCFYHEYDFIGRGFSGASVNLLRSDKLNKYNAIFCCSAIQKTAMAKASYGYLFNSDRLKNGTIMLPIDSKGNPNWQFMEDYVKQEMKEQSQKVVSYYENKLLKLAFELLDLEVEWKEFFFTDIFKEIKRGKRLTKGNQIDGKTPYVSSTGFNNGVDNFIGNEKGVRRYNNNLSLANSGSVGSCFYHNYEYVASDHITALTSENADEYVYKFMAVIIKRLEEKYSFNREINDKRISREKIFLPIDKNGNPNWEYMGKFVKNLEKENIEKVLEYIYIYNLANKLSEKYKFNNVFWKEYFIEDVCDIKSGVRLTRNNQIDGLTPFIGAIDNNNGITNLISNINNSLDKNVLGVNYNGSVVETFYHPYNCIFSDDVKRVSFKDKKYNNEFTLLFLKQTIIQQKEKYQYGYKFNGKRMSRQKILLPSTNNTPDYDFMKKYIIIQEINSIKNIIKFY